MDGFGFFGTGTAAFGGVMVFGGVTGCGVPGLGFGTEAAPSSEVHEAEIPTLVGPELDACPA